jgi:WXG100 family type VII secretion target
MGVDGGILVRAEALESAASDVDAIAGQIKQQLDDLRGTVVRLTAQWTGEAADNYHKQQSDWDFSAADLHGVLQQIAAGLRQAAESYSQSEKTNATMFGG